MELSLFLAKVIGLTLVLISTSMLVKRKNVDLLFKAYQHPAVIYITGFLETFLGLSLIMSHNIWVVDFRVIITIIGWVLLLRGSARLFAPTDIPPVLKKFQTMKRLFTPLLVILLLLGLYLAYAGFSTMN